jgi:hypothetical protein
MSTYLVIVLVALVVTFLVTITLSSKIIASTDVLFFIIVAACIVFLSNPKSTSHEEYVNAITGFPNSIKKVGTKTQDEIDSIAQQTWSETITNEELFTDVSQYYSTFSYDSIASLTGSPNTWLDMKDPKNRITFNKIDWAGGLAKGLNMGGGARGMGPASMALGIPYGTNQEFTIFYLCRYNSNPVAASGINVVSTFANTQSNNGVLMEFDATSDNNLNVFQITPRIQIADKDMAFDPFYVNTQNLYLHAVVLTRQNGTYLAKYSVVTIDDKSALLNEYKQTLPITDPIFLSNKSIEIGDDKIKSSPLSLYCLGFVKRALLSKEIGDLGKYFLGINLKLSVLAVNLYNLFGEITMCPYDKVTCDACSTVNLANPNNILLASTDCKKQLDTYCSAHPNDIGCDCYKKENLTEPYCGYWKKMLQGAPTLCSVSEQVTAPVPATDSGSCPVSSSNLTPPPTPALPTSHLPVSKPAPTPAACDPPKSLGFWDLMSSIVGFTPNPPPTDVLVFAPKTAS